MENNSGRSVFIFPALFSHLPCFFKLKIYLLPAVLLLLFCLSLPAQAAVQGFVACSSDGGYHQYAYQELLDSYALKLSGKQGALYSDYAQKKPVALLSSSGLYVDYGDVLNAYARALLAEELFDLSLYLESKAVSRAAMQPMPAAVTAWR